MHAIIDAAINRNRTVLLLLGFILLVGAVSYSTIPKEASPDIPIPTFYVVTTLEGVSPEDAERLLIRPFETEFQSLTGLDEMKGTAAEGYASVTLEFDPGIDPKEALNDIREAVDRAKSELPQEAEEPTVNEINLALFPILTVVLSGDAPQRTLVELANQLEDQIESLQGVLSVDIGGEREEVVEILVDPAMLDTYDISFETLLDQVRRNNRLVAAGSLDTGAGRIALKVPGVIEDLQDVLNLPVKVSDGTVVTFKDVASIRRTFRDPESFARLGGSSSISLEVKKRLGANIIETVSAVRALIEVEQQNWPDTISVDYLQDGSEPIEMMLGDLENNVVAAIVLVMIVIVAALGLRSSILVGVAIPGAFLGGIAIMHILGFTLNMIVLFSLILVVGMLVDGAIVTTELADRKLQAGYKPKDAFASAAKRMAWPIITSTVTTLAVFFPLLFWGDIVGEFMKFIPITVIITLSASLFMALIFIPVLGSVIAEREKPVSTVANPQTEKGIREELSLTSGRSSEFTKKYVHVLNRFARRPYAVFAVAVSILLGTFTAYGALGSGVTFFPEIEPEFLRVQIHARDNLSVWEKDALVRQAEDRILPMTELEHVYVRTIGGRRSSNLSEDVIGVIQLELVDWQLRRPAVDIIDDIRMALGEVPGVKIEVRSEEMGPSQGKPIQLRVSGREDTDLAGAVAQIRTVMEEIGGFVDAEDGRPLPGIEWALRVDRTEAARFGADVTVLGQAVQLLTMGIAVAEYRPNDADDEVDIRARFPQSDRTLEQLEELRIPTRQGYIPIRNFVNLEPTFKTGTIERINSRRVMRIEADVEEGLLVNNQVQALQSRLAGVQLPPGVDVQFVGEFEDQNNAATFLISAFFAAVFLMLVVLVTQFNSIYQAFLVLSAIVFSTAGVLFLSMVLGRPFGIVMGGIGVIALAGIVVNNNIVLIDTYNQLRRQEGMSPVDAVVAAGAERLRPILLTSITTILGLLPMVFGVNIDLIGRAVSVGGPSSLWWTELSSAIAGGLAFSTVLTLLLTPTLLLLGEDVSVRWRTWRNARRVARSAPSDDARSARA